MNAQNISYEHSHHDLLKGGLIIKGEFPAGETSCTVPVDTLSADDLLIPFTQQPTNQGSSVQEIYASRSTGIPGTFTVALVSQNQAGANIKFGFLLIRKGIGRILPTVAPSSPSLLYNHPNGVYAYLVTTVAGSYQDITIPGIQLAPQDIIYAYKITSATDQPIGEVIGRRRPTVATADTFRLANLDSDNPLPDAESVVVLIFKHQTYNVTTATEAAFMQMSKPFGAMDIAKKNVISNDPVDGIPYINSDSIALVPTFAQSGAPELCENIVARTPSASGGGECIIVPVDSLVTPSILTATCDLVIIQTQGRVG